jgi:mannosyl-oligosaccharide glucosidase
LQASSCTTIGRLTYVYVFHRGAIWININYLALDALKHYASLEGPYRQRCSQVYFRLRQNILRTILGEFNRTGYIWEQYDDSSGQGIRGRPFTGWSALVVNIMTEIY